MKTETLLEFYKSKIEDIPVNLKNGIGHFNVFRLEDCHSQQGSTIGYSRRDFYKICLIRGNNRYHYADKSIEASGSTLIFFNPQVPYSWEHVSGEITGHFCIFTESFFAEKLKGKLSELPMFTQGGKPTYFLTKEQDQEVTRIFEKMVDELNSDYVYKYDLLLNYTVELIHYALKKQPTETIFQHPDANSRITAIFTELLERQFPIENTSQRFMLRSAKDFSAQLAIHVNHLNRAIKVTTGKTTTHFISERILSEAKALLKHTDWNISEISYCLGFEEAAHFNNFFRKQTLQTPSTFRNV